MNAATSANAAPSARDTVRRRTQPMRETLGAMRTTNARPHFDRRPLARSLAAHLMVVATLLACSRDDRSDAPSAAAAQRPAARPVTNAKGGEVALPTTAAGASASIVIPARDSEDGQWLMPAKDYASTRFSGLDQITATNVASLKLAWSFSTGVLRGQEAAPLVVGSTMYVVTPYPNILYALDLTKPGAPVKWKYEPKPLAASQGVACCDVVNRGAAYADGKIFYNTLDNQTVAVDA